MKHSKKLLTPAECLYKALSPPCQLQQQRRLASQYRPFRPSEQPLPPTSPEAKTEPRQAQMMPGLQKRLAGFTINKDIGPKWVQVKNKNNKLGEPQMLDALLDEIDHSTQVVRQLAAPGAMPDTAIVEISDIASLLKAAAARDTAVKAVERQKKSQQPKQLELNWAISENDLEMKLRQMQQFLEKGRKVEILLAAKKRQRKATPEEAEAVMERLREKLEEVGAKELNMKGKLLAQAVMTVQMK